MTMILDPQERLERLNRALGVRPHTEGCPGEDGNGRVEAFEQTAAAPGPALRHVKPGAKVVTIRCMECAGVRHIEGTLDEVLERAAP